MGHIASIASKQGDETIEKLLKANPLLESFGNAKTIRNDNSSRFGKFSQLEFDINFMLVGSKCVTYLLEKSRVVSQSANERNYHIFYQLFSAPEETKESLCLGDRYPNDFAFTNGGDVDTDTIEGMSDGDRYELTREALALLGVGDKLRFMLEQCLAGLLHLGEVNFVPGESDSKSDAIALERDEGDPENDTIATCCRLFSVQDEVFCKASVSRTIEVQGKKLSVPLTEVQAATGRDALAKEIYARMFQWLVLVINYNTAFSPQRTNEKKPAGAGGGGKPPSRSGAASQCSTISLLDIFGFESFAINRFEQLCINFANEKLQQKFTQVL